MVGGAVLRFLLCTPASELHLATAILGIVLCVMLWLTQQLLGLVTLLDLELTKALDVLTRTLPEDARRELFRH